MIASAYTYGAVLRAGRLLHSGDLAAAMESVPSHGTVQALMQRNG